jgi:uncharacterized protein YndB with AHSA1/START domain
VAAGIEKVWEAFTTKAGLEAWMAPLVEIELAVGGVIRSNYNPKGTIGDATTIENTILAYDPQRMLALKATKYPEGFPFAEAAAVTWSVFYFDEAGPGHTKITLVGLGYTDSSESQQMRAAFAEWNAHSLRQLQAALGGTGAAGTP